LSEYVRGKYTYPIVGDFCLFLIGSLHVYAEEEHTPVELSLYVFEDGVADIEYKIEVDPTLARVNITLIGKNYENFIVRDRDGLLLDYDLFEGYATIDVLGSPLIEIDYATHDITNKTRSIWNLHLLSPINTNIHLPEGATIMGLNPTPLSITIADDKATLTMPQGEIEIDYLLGTIGTREHALVLINEAESAIEMARALEIKAEAAESLLQQAREAYDEAQYNKAETLALQAKNITMATISLANEVKTALESAEHSITSAMEAGRTSLLDKASQELQQAKQAYDLGNYEEALTLATQAEATAQQSKSTYRFLDPEILVPIGAVSTIILLIIFYYAKKRTKTATPSLEEEIFDFDTEAIFRQHPRLRLEEKEVIRFIVDAGGGVFTSEIRRRFDIPRSSVWRMIRRLEEEGIVQTEIVGRENHIKINPKYR